MRGCDFSWGVVPGRERELAKALKAQGFGFVVRYLSQTTSKVITRAEADAYHAEGLGIVTVYEDGAAWMTGGLQAGADAAALAQRQLAEAGAPGHAPVYLADDFQVTPAQFDVLDACVAGAEQVHGKDQTGIYGPLAAVQDIRARYRWQTAAWSGGQWDGGDSIRQYATGGTTFGVQWDLDESRTADFGQWQWPQAPHVSDYITTGKESLAQVAQAHGTRTAVIIRLTLEYDKLFVPHLASYIDAENLNAPMPRGITLRVPGPAVVIEPKPRPVRKAAVAVRAATIRTGNATHAAIASEPALTAGGTAGILSAVLALFQHHLGLHLTVTEVNAAITTLVAWAGIVTTIDTRPVRVGVIATALATLATAVASFGIHLPPSVVGGEMPVAALIAALLVRSHVSPKSAPGGTAVG